MFKKVIASAFMSALIAPSVVMAADNTEQQFVKVWETDFSGRPPFKRVMKTIPLVDTAALELVETETETVTKRVVEFSGKPPFKRKTVEVPLVDAASLEIGLEDADDETEAKAKSPMQSKARFKRHP